MHAVVNHLHFAEPVDRDLFRRAQAEMSEPARGVDGFVRMIVVEAGPDHAILVIEGEDAAAVERLATEVGGPWMSANVVPLLAGPPERSVGPVIAEIRR